MEVAGFSIEKANTGDIPAMLQLWKTIPGLGEGDGEHSLEVFMQRNPTTCLVLRERRRLIGTVLGGFDGHRGYIYHLAVHPAYQGRKLGQALFNAVSSELTALGAPKIHLFVYCDNQTAINFYQGQMGEQRQDIYVFSWNHERWNER